jgi:hypothetical protein
MAIERFAPTVYLTRANLRSTPGPLVEKFAICVDGPEGIYRFAVGDTTADDDWTCIVPQGGRAGAWLLLDHSVAVLADLPATAAEGAKTYVRSRRSWYQFSGDAWIRTLETDPAWARSTDVFVNYDTGSDDGAGTADDPLATVPEAYARLGRHAVASDTYFTIYQTGNATESAWDLSAVTTTTQPITHYGVPTVLLSTTVTVGAWTPATNTYGTLTGGSSLAAYAASSQTTNGKLFRVVGGARDGLHGTLRLHLGAGVVQYELPAYLWTPGGTALVTGDTIEILDCPAMPASLLQRRGTVIFFAYLSGLSAGTHAMAVEQAADAWFSACSLTGDVDGRAGANLSFVGCAMAGHDVRCEEQGTLEICNGRHHGFAARLCSMAHLEDVTLENRSLVEEGAIARHRAGHVWLAYAGAGAVEVYPRGSWIATAAAGVVCGTGLVGSTVGMIQLHGNAIYAGPVPVCTGTGWQFGVAGTQRSFSDAAVFYTTGGASIGPRS